MPTCCLKSCANRSGRNNKSEGITFHRLPRENEFWRNDWINIIKENRNENDWEPNNKTVVCSVHFESHNLYTTKGGLTKVVHQAVPTKFLTSRPHVDLQEQAMQLKASTFTINKEDTDSSPADEPMSVFGTTNIKPSDHMAIEGASSATENSMDYNHISLENEMVLKKEVLDPIPVDVNIEEPTSILFTASNRRLKNMVYEGRMTIAKQKKKIQTLNNKVRSLKMRNLTLKNILKTIRMKTKSKLTQKAL